MKLFSLIDSCSCIKFVKKYVNVCKKAYRENNAKKPQNEAIIFPSKSNVELLFFSNDPLLILRFFAAFCVFVTHALIMFKMPASVNKMLVGCAHCGMSIFFVLSGYLMGKAFIKKRYSFSYQGIMSFYENRLMRIAPLMLSVLFIILVFMYPEKLKNNFLDLWRILSFAFAGTAVGGGSPFSVAGIGAFWSLSVEMQYYLLAPFVFYIFGRFLDKKINVFLFYLACFGLIHANMWYQSEISMDIGNSVFFTLQGQLPFFLMGFATNYLIKDFEKIKLSRSGFYIRLSAIIAAFILFYVGETFIYEKKYKYAVVSAGYICCVFIYFLERFKVEAKEFSRSINIYTILQSLGVLSYGFYLWHSAIGTVYFEKVKPVFNATGDYNMGQYLFEVGILFFISMALSLWSYYFVEKKFLEKKVYL